MFYLKKRTGEDKPNIPIYMRITMGGRRTEWFTGRHCTESEWDGGAKRIKGTKEYARSINSWLDLLYSKAHSCRQELYATGKAFSPMHIKKMLVGEELEPPKMLSHAWDYHTNQIAGLLGKGFTPATLQKYKSTYRVLKKFLLLKTQSEDIRLDDIGFQLVRDFDYYLKADYGVKINTAVQMVKKLRTIMKVANEIGWAKRNPFVAYRAKKEEVFREFLTTEELRDLTIKKVKKRLNLTRDLFLFSCYTGLSYADIIKLKSGDILKGDDGGIWLQTHRVKNNNRVRLPLLAPALKLINHYKDFPRYLDEDFLLPKISNGRANFYLKEIARSMGWTKWLTFHCARHTFATTVTLTNGVPIETVGQMLGHKNIRSTQIYARVTDTKVSVDMKSLKKKHAGQELVLTTED
ncbi:site-specific integrase [Mucilaginibacter aquatilis]|uniref:Tyrosine-type recombinase/integrase n=1 Tax=Mucilaginibacter aquatilis TaxID=1517760 RepID=A0A6I4IAF4_9SPHI|nr:site-specific integrase [Mucilaginibacter aquatilis]MVN90496.1 tyrosine-type recombinase/integrase [Mucilaginibacter aquatilis]